MENKQVQLPIIKNSLIINVDENSISMNPKQFVIEFMKILEKGRLVATLHAPRTGEFGDPAYYTEVRVSNDSGNLNVTNQRNSSQAFLYSFIFEGKRYVSMDLKSPENEFFKRNDHIKDTVPNEFIILSKEFSKGQLKKLSKVTSEIGFLNLFTRIVGPLGFSSEFGFNGRRYQLYNFKEGSYNASIYDNQEFYVRKMKSLQSKESELSSQIYKLESERSKIRTLMNETKKKIV